MLIYPFEMDFDFVRPWISDIEKLNHIASDVESSISVPLIKSKIISPYFLVACHISF